MFFSHLIILTCLVCLAAFGAGCWLYVEYKKKFKINLATVTSIFWSLVVGVLLIECVFYWQQEEIRIPAMLAGLAGASIGWLLGMWISPMGRTESTKFAKYWTAIGVGSGFTLKWALDHVVDNAATFKTHWFVTAVFLIACFVTAAAVYNSRAYNDSLDISVRLVPGGTDVTGTNPVKIKADKSAAFYTTVTGPSDPLCSWEVIPASLGTIDEAGGLFTAGNTPTVGRITAFSVEDPTLSNYIDVEVV